MSATDAATPEEQRALSRDELELADQSRQPTLGHLSDRGLSDLVSRLRDRRNRARDISDRQGREARGKADPAGISPAGGNEGTRSKADYLTAALDRAMAERDRRQSAPDVDSQPSQVELAQKAMELKQDGQTPNPMMEEGAPLHPMDPDASSGKKGMAATERNTAPSGALDHAGDLPARERSRTRY
ncbi:MAG: hypothetical protein FJX25_17095 [Alphaproteobacteria bacterium]|nr:hypothetical protein [Alphaproteobacteria bacterium]